MPRHRACCAVEAVDWYSTLSSVDPRYVAAGVGGLLVLFLGGRALSRRPAKPEDTTRPAEQAEARDRADEAAAAPASEPAPASGKQAVASTVAPTPLAEAPVPRITFDDGCDDEEEPTSVSTLKAPAQVAPAIVYDEDASIDEPTGAQPLFLLSASAQSDVGRRRKRNEDAVLVLEQLGIFAVADGMGGISGGEIASSIAVDTIREMFERSTFASGEDARTLPRRAAELASAIRKANEAILGRARDQRELKGMGTTLTAARFSMFKQRLYLAHVGDSRVYRMRGGELRMMTTDHTMEELGVKGDEAGNLSRALGVWPRVPVDIVLAKPMVGDVYLLCSDGLTKMVDEPTIKRTLGAAGTLHDTARALVDAANANGGKDNVSVVLVKVEAPQAVAAAG